MTTRSIAPRWPQGLTEYLLKEVRHDHHDQPGIQPGHEPGQTRHERRPCFHHLARMLACPEAENSDFEPGKLNASLFKVEDLF